MSQIQELEAQKIELTKQVELRDAILKLSGNHEFRKVVHEGFLRDDCARNARIAGDPSLDEKQQKDAMQMSLAAGHFQRYLSANVQMGNEEAAELQAKLSALGAARKAGTISEAEYQRRRLELRKLAAEHGQDAQAQIAK